MAKPFKTHVDEITYNYLACSHPVNVKCEEQNMDSFTCEDFKFYRRRLQTLFKERMNTAAKKQINVSMIASNIQASQENSEYIVFDALVNRIILEGIKIFKVLDYNELQHEEVMSVLNDDKVVQDIPCGNVKDCNKILFLKPKNNTTLDNYVIKKTRLGAGSDLSFNYPVQDKFNLKTEELKKKGVRKK